MQGESMAENQGSYLETVPVEEAGYWNMIQNEAFLRLLVEKGITTKDGFLNLVHAVHEELEQETGEDEGENDGPSS
jgi:hypothetical protein